MFYVFFNLFYCLLESLDNIWKYEDQNKTDNNLWKKNNKFTDNNFTFKFYLSFENFLLHSFVTDLKVVDKN